MFKTKVCIIYIVKVLQCVHMAVGSLQQQASVTEYNVVPLLRRVISSSSSLHVRAALEGRVFFQALPGAWAGKPIYWLYSQSIESRYLKAEFVDIRSVSHCISKVDTGKRR